MKNHLLRNWPKWLGAFASLLIISFIWKKAPSLVGAVADGISATVPECKVDPSGESCKWAHSRLGVTGDIFGSVSALFSGLGLFAVAVTLWLDASARQKAKKPLVVCKFNDDSLALDRASVEVPKSLRLTIKAKARNSGEVALNCQIEYSISINNEVHKLPVSAVDEPLATGVEVDVVVTHLIQGAQLESLLAAIRLEQSLVLITNVECDSLEGVRWSTTVKHNIRCLQEMGRSRLVSLERSTTDFESQWEGAAAVSLTMSVEPRSWIYKSV